MPKPYDLSRPIGPGERASRPFSPEQAASTNLTGAVVPFKDQCAAQTTGQKNAWPPLAPPAGGKPFR